MARKRQTVIKTRNRSAELLRTVREAQGLTVDDVARLVPCSRRTVLRYEADGVQSSTRANRVRALCMAYGVSCDALIDAACMEA